MKILHVTSHLGGGVGRVLSKLTTHNKSNSDEIVDSIICLEAARDTRYADSITNEKIKLVFTSDLDRLHHEIAEADIVQIEWWHHPLMAKTLLELGPTLARWVIWSHVSGLHYPMIPTALSHLPHAFIATTPATLPLLEDSIKKRENILSYVFSTGGFDDFPLSTPKQNKDVRCGYLGSLNIAKLHPHILDYISAVQHPGFSIDFYGESSVNPQFEKAVQDQNMTSRIRLHGFCNKPQDVLPTLDLFIYPLNPTHYGTTENALLEAMACGAVPIVLNNPVELSLIKHGETGFAVDSPESFAKIIAFLLDHPEERQRVSQNASGTVRREFSVPHSATKLAGIYHNVMAQEKKIVNFATAFGHTPSSLFLSCLGDYTSCFTAIPAEKERIRRLELAFLYEKSKSSVSHFRDYFPDDPQLVAWEMMLYNDLAHLKAPPSELL